MYGPDYVWMLPGYFGDGWWMSEHEGVTCTAEQLKTASEGYLTTAFSKYGMGSEPTVGGMVSDHRGPGSRGAGAMRATIKPAHNVRGLTTNGPPPKLQMDLYHVKQELAHALYKIGGQAGYQPIVVFHGRAHVP